MATRPSTRCPPVQDSGITELYTPSEHEAVADVIFVHGLKGHPHRTWQTEEQHNGPEEKATKGSFKSYWLSKLSKKRDIQPVSREASETHGSCYWPWDLLPADFDNIRILVYGYDSHPSHFYQAANQMNISQHGRNLLGKVVDCRKKCKTRPIVFVAHSLGGIIVKEAIVESTKYVQQRHMQDVANSCRAIFFFGTPHRGASAAEWGLMLSNIVRTIPLGPSTYADILKGLTPDSEKLDNLRRDFDDILNADIPVEQKIKIFSFQEGKGMTGVARFDGKVVPDGSGSFGRRDIEVTAFISENHVNMCRFRSKSDSGYSTFKSNLENYLEGIQETAAGPQDIHQAALLERLDYKGRHVREDQLWEIRADSETFQWVWHSSFADWLAGSNGLFWICGNPATGKSTLMHHVAKSDDLRTFLKKGNDRSWTVVYHFFFDFGAEKDSRNNFEGVLRSLLYQLAEKLRDNDFIRDLAGSDLSGTMNRQPWCIRTLHERLIIVLERHANSICMLLDGLDEYCGDKWDLVKFLNEIASARVKLCVASRPSPEFDISFGNTPTIKMQDQNRPGIDRMVNLTIQSSMAGSGFYDDKDIVKLAAEISEKANGCFLWARFAINEIRAGWAEGLDLVSLRKKLDDVPVELEQIYARIFKRVKPDQRQQAAHMLQLVCYAIESLSLEELYVATTLASGDQSPSWQQITPNAIKKFRKRIHALTGGVLQTFESDRSSRYLHSRGVIIVEVIHKTVRTFLDSKGWLQLLGEPHEGLLHAEVLWLRVCVTLFPTSFNGLPPVSEDYRGWLELMRVRQEKPGASTYQPLLQAAEQSDNVNLPDELSPLIEYSATFMLRHARNVERDCDLALYNLLQPGISHSFMYYHRLIGLQRGRTSCGCVGGPEPLHFLHMAIAHRLDRYVTDFLSLLFTRTLPGSREWNDIFYLEVPYHDQQIHRNASIQDYFQMSLLEFSLHHVYRCTKYDTSKPSIVTTLLDHDLRPLDAEMIYALKHTDPSLVLLLLSYWPTGKMILKPDPKRTGIRFRTDDLGLFISESFQCEYIVGPLWCIFRRGSLGMSEQLEYETLLDLFLRRGEDINDLCCPVGTALHGAILDLDDDILYLPCYSIGSLIARGADVNAHGPFGTPLELAWKIARRDDGSTLEDVRRMTRAVRELIQHGAINSQCDPDGLIPSKDSMLTFCYLIDMQCDGGME